jgi:hypothetical protein
MPAAVPETVIPGRGTNQTLTTYHKNNRHSWHPRQVVLTSQIVDRTHETADVRAEQLLSGKDFRRIDIPAL